MFFKKRKKNTEQELDEFLEGYELPSFPGIIMEALSLLRDSNISMQKVSDLLNKDPGMHVRVLKTVNSSAYGLSKKISNLHHALNLLGKSRIESILLTHAVKDRLPDIHLKNFNLKQFWFVSSFRASLAKILADKLHPATKNEAFTAGLLQDMAIPVIALIKNKQYDSILEKWQNNTNFCLVTLEKEVLGYDHQKIGQMMAQSWDFPEYLINAISNHHETNGDVGVDPSVQLVSYLRNGRDTSEFSQLIEKCHESYNLGYEQTESYIKTASEESEQFSSSLN